MNKRKIYIVATINNSGSDDDDYFQDIVLVTTSEKKAKDLVKKLNSYKGKIKGFDRLNMDYAGAVYFERNMNDLSIWR